MQKNTLTICTYYRVGVTRYVFFYSFLFKIKQLNSKNNKIQIKQRVSDRSSDVSMNLENYFRFIKKTIHSMACIRHQLFLPDSEDNGKKNLRNMTEGKNVF